MPARAVYPGTTAKVRFFPGQHVRHDRLAFRSPFGVAAPLGSSRSCNRDRAALLQLWQGQVAAMLRDAPLFELVNLAQLQWREAIGLMPFLTTSSMRRPSAES